MSDFYPFLEFKCRPLDIELKSSQQLSDLWDICNDNIFARDVFRNLTLCLVSDVFPKAPEASSITLCSSCSSPTSGILSNDFSVTPAQTSAECGLCQVLSRYFREFNERSNAHTRLSNVGSSLGISSTAPPVFSIVIGPGKSCFSINQNVI
jgi:hypothetical protein